MHVPLRQVCGRASTRAVLDFAWERGRFRADDVMAALGLTRSTTLQALDALLHIGLMNEVEEDRSEITRLGRPARHFEFRRDAGLLVGVDAGGHRISAVVADLTGQLLARKSVTVAGWRDEVPRDAELRRQAAFDAVDGALAAVSAARDDVVSVAVGIPAPVDGAGRSPEDGIGFWQAMNAGFKDHFGDVFHSVRVENDAALAALAEGWIGAATGLDHYVALLAGWRFGAGIVLDGRLVRGRQGGVGEMGALAHVLGHEGAWGLSQLAVHWAREHATSDQLPEDHPWQRFWAEDERAELLFEHTAVDDPLAHRFIEDLAQRLALTASMLTAFFDPQRIVVCGAAVGQIGTVLQRANELLPTMVDLPSPELVASPLAADVVPAGAVSAAQEVAREIVLEWATARADAAGKLD